MLKVFTVDVVGACGKIKGCFDETFYNITVKFLLFIFYDYLIAPLRLLKVGDKLREMLLNENSENASVFTEEDRSETIFHLFRIFAVGGSLCQPDTDINRLIYNFSLYFPIIAIVELYYFHHVDTLKLQKTCTKI